MVSFKVLIFTLSPVLSAPAGESADSLTGSNANANANSNILPFPQPYSYPGRYSGRNLPKYGQNDSKSSYYDSEFSSNYYVWPSNDSEFSANYYIWPYYPRFSRFPRFF